MNNRRQRGEIQGPKSRYGKPPHGSWQRTVPSWEKKFCSSVGSIPWGKLLEAKKFMYLYENVVQWNDSAGEEAFHNAKKRFWSKINGLPCNISLPDPDIYIDKIDWNSNIDPELLLDLEREPKDPDERDKGEEVVILGNSFLFNQSFSCNGWGDAEEELQNIPNSALDPGYGCCFQDVRNENPWEINNTQTNKAMKDDGWGNCWRGNSYNGWDNNYNEWKNANDGSGGECGMWDEDDGWGNCWRGNSYNGRDNNYNEWKNAHDGSGGECGMWDGNNPKKEGAGWHVSRYKTTRFHRDDYQMDRGWWRSGRGKRRVNFVC